MKLSKPRKVLVSTVAHATEDPARVSSAVLNICPEGFPKKMAVSRTKGHFGNEIRICRLESRKPSDAALFLENALAHLSKSDREALVKELGERLDSTGVLHLRFDKQEAERGLFAIRESDPIKVEVAFQLTGSRTRVVLDDIMQELLEALRLDACRSRSV